MLACPSCHQSVEIQDKHLGTLFTCPHCNAVFFVDWNGQPELAEHEVPTELPPLDGETIAVTPQDEFAAETKYESAPDFEPPIQNFESSQNFNEAYAEPEAIQENTDQPIENNFENIEQPVINEAPFESPVDASNEEVEAAPYDFNKTLDSVNELPPQSMSDTSDFSDVTDFANSNEAMSPISYTVQIEGIESSLLLSQLREAMIDSRFSWDVEELLHNVGEGRIVLPGLNPAKASILINRIKYLPFKITWRQDVLSGS